MSAPAVRAPAVKAPNAAAPAATGTVALRALSVWYGPRQALADVSLDVPARAVTALVGPSGSGKSTLLRAVNRLVELTPGARQAGRVLVGGDDVRAPGVDAAALRQRVGMVFPRPAVFRASVYDNVAYGARLAGARAGDELDAVVELSLRRAALWDEVRDRLRAPAAALSGGQQQRLCIARALAPQPEVLLLDEPTGALDPGAAQRIEELLYALRHDVTVLLVTHNLQQAARAAEHTAVLFDGRVAEFGASDQLFTAPRDPRTEAYITGRFG